MMQPQNFLKILIIVCLSITSVNTMYAQERIEISDLYKDKTFQVLSVHGIASMNDGLHYTKLNDKKTVISKYSYQTGDVVKEIIDVTTLKERDLTAINDYQFSADEKKILISANKEPIYRLSFKATYFIYDIENGKLTKLSENGKQQLASFSPDGKQIAFVRDNNLFVKDLALNKEMQLTSDGLWNHIINGAPDWVYEEEFKMRRAYEWSEDSRKIGFIKFDESHVKMFSMTTYGGAYPARYQYKYPKAGEENSKVSLHIVDIATQKTVKADIGDLTDKYIPKLQFTKDANILSAVKMNRLQNNYELYFVNATDGSSTVVLSLTDPKYIELADDLTFFNDQKHFVMTHTQDGYRHIYLYDMTGKEVRQITSGAWEVTALYEVDEKNKTIYFEAAKTSPLNREIYAIGTSGKNLKQLSPALGINSAKFSQSGQYFINSHSDANTPTSVALYNNKGELIRELQPNTELTNKVKNQYQFVEKEFFTFTTEDSIELNGWMIKPRNFDPNKKYPVFMYVYGGPGSQTVKNNWERDMGWYQYLAQEGYIVVSVDNRGTAARGKEFRQYTYAQLGKYEVLDQIEAAKYLGKQSYVDANRIGIFGWSYGGYMSTLCMTLGADYFKLGIAVAPVTNWRFYDSIYTERYNGLPQDNAEGYDKNAPIDHVSKMKGKYLLIHGTSDDNVHFENSVELVNELIKADVQFETMYYPNKNHSILGEQTRHHLYTLMTRFIVENL